MPSKPRSFPCRGRGHLHALSPASDPRNTRFRVPTPVQHRPGIATTISAGTDRAFIRNAPAKDHVATRLASPLSEKSKAAFADQAPLRAAQLDRPRCAPRPGAREPGPRHLWSGNRRIPTRSGITVHQFLRRKDEILAQPVFVQRVMGQEIVLGPPSAGSARSSTIVGRVDTS